METTEVIKKHEKSFFKIRRLLQLLVVLTIAAIVFIQHENILRFFKWLSSSN